MRSRLTFVLIGLIAGLTFDAFTALAWTGPSATAPNNNVGAPVNVGTTAQVKNGDFGANNISAFGNALLSGLGVGTGRYLNFDYTSGGTSGTGSAGYGIRDNAGTLEFKNLGGSWASLQSLLSGGFWSLGTGGIYYNGGNVGIGATAPSSKLQVVSSAGGAGNTNLLMLSYDTAGTADYSFYRNGTTGALALQGSQTNNNNIALAPTSGNVGVGVANPTGAKLVISSGDLPSILMGPNSSAQYLELGQYGNPGGNASIGVSNGNLHIDSKAGAFGLYLNYFTSGGIDVGHGGGVMTVEHGIAASTPSGYALQLTGQAAQWTEVVNWPNTSATQYGLLVGTCASCYNLFESSNGYVTYINNSTWGIYTNVNIGAAAFLYVSDKRFKDNVKSLDLGLLTLMKLRPVSFTWNEKDPNGRAGKSDIGFIAQEVEKVIPEAVSTDPKTGFKSVDYPRLMPILVKAIQDQQATISSQQSKIDDLETRIARLEAKLGQ